MKKKGLLFTSDAVIALVILFFVMMTLSVVVFPNRSDVRRESEVSYDLMKVLTDIKIGELNDPYAQGIPREQIDDLNSSVLEQIGVFYISDKNTARDLSLSILNNLNLDENVGIWFGNDLIASVNSSPISESDNVEVSRQTITGLVEGESAKGFSSRLFLESSFRSKYFYFGGYVGDGNISFVLDFEGEAENIEKMVLEIATNDNFTGRINGDFAGSFSKAENDTIPKEFDLTIYNRSFINGENTVKFIGDNKNLFISGGFFRIDYTSDEILRVHDDKYFFPGVEGLINVYDGFYIPGQLNSMEIFLNYSSIYDIFLTIGNTTIYTGNSTDDDGGVVTITDSELKNQIQLDYDLLVNKTTPLRLALDNVSYELDLFLNVDVISVTDLSGSMRRYNRMEDAKEANNVLIDGILNRSGNMLGLVGYRSSVSEDECHLLSNNNISLNNLVDSWYAEGGTCICCGINTAVEYLNDEEKRILIDEMGFWNVSSQESEGWKDIDFDDSSWEKEQMPDFLLERYVSEEAKNNIRIIFNAKDKDSLSDIYEKPFIDYLSDEGYDVIVISDGEVKEFNYQEGDLLIIRADADSYSQHPETDLDSLSVEIISMNRYTSRHDLGMSSSSGSRTYDSYDIQDETHPFLEGYIGTVKLYDSSAAHQGIWRLSSGVDLPISESGRSTYAGVAIKEGDNIRAHWSAHRGNILTKEGEYLFENLILYMAGYASPTITYNTGEWYLRKSFNLNDFILEPSLFLYFDDEAEVYLNGILIYNSSEDYSGGSSGYWKDEITLNPNYFSPEENIFAVKLLNEDEEYGGFDLKLEGYFASERMKVMVVMSDGGANEKCSLQGTGSAKQDAINASCDANRDHGIIVHAVGFGSGADENTLKEIAKCGKGNYYYADSGDIVELYDDIAREIIEAAYEKQTMIAIGNIDTKLYPSSYIEFNYSTDDNPEGVVFNIQKDFYNSSFGNFSVPEDTKVVDANVISYSGSYWTSLASINGESFYNLSEYKTEFTELGDPYYIGIPVEKIDSSQGNVNEIVVKRGLSFDKSFNGSEHNKIIYRLVKEFFLYSQISRFSEGCIWEVHFEGDEERVNVTIPSDYDGGNICNYSIDGHLIYDNNDAMQSAAFELLSEMDLNNNGFIDFRFTDYNLRVNSVEVVGIPYVWSTEMQVRRWY